MAGLLDQRKPTRGLLDIAKYGDGGLLSSYEPSLRDKVNYWLADHWYGDTRQGVEQAKNLSNVLETVTPYGLLTGAYDAGRSVGSGDYLGAGIAGAMTALPLPAPVEKEAKQGIRAFHGSPHSFDRFSMDKIGTGEGAQAYGPGLYFAQNEDVAQAYKNALTRKTPVSGQIFSQTNASDLYRGLSIEDQSTLDSVLGKIGDAPSLDEARKDVAKLGKNAVRVFENRVAKFLSNPSPGSMYEVRINANPDDFLDWDKPLSEQPHATAAANKIFDPGWNDGSWTPTGKDLVGKVDQRKRAEILKKAGIPGIKYLDAGSRGKGDGSRNYVVFDDKLIEIVRKYGIAGAASLLGYNFMQELTPAQQNQLKMIEG